MVCSEDDLLDWNDFPKGLRVLLLEEDMISASEIRSKLEEMDYAVSVFYKENEALLAISDDSEGFHVAIVEVSEANSGERFKFLENANELPTIMISDVNCLSTMMKCIALGAVEFLKKPLSEDKLRNIWQHVVHKAFNTGKDLSESLKPIKESVASILQLQSVKKEPNGALTVETTCDSLIPDNVELSAVADKYPAPSTPQIKQGVRLLDDRDCQDQAYVSIEKESLEQDGESKFVETTCDNLVFETSFEETTHPPQRLEEERLVTQEVESVGGASKSESNVSSHPSNKTCSTDFVNDQENSNKVLDPANSHGVKSGRRKVKVKVDWTPELHKKFVQAVEQLGVDQAIPSRILELMSVEGLTRHNVASHLQKYRIQRRHILPKENVRRWPNPNSMSRNYYPHKPVMAYPPYQNSNHAFPSSQTFPGWVTPGSYPPYMWGPPHYSTWPSTESWQYNYPVMHADAWGCPMLPPPVGPCPSFPQAEEVLDKVVKDAISKPWLPLPLGLKPPSTESVLTELTKQGISTIPPCTSDAQPC